MALRLQPGQLEKLIGTFYRVNARNPPSKPEVVPNLPLERLVITKGLLKLTFTDKQADVIVPVEERVLYEQYDLFVNILAQELATLLQVPEHWGNIMQALKANGLVAQFHGSQLQMNPLSASVGEQDQF